MSESTLSKLVNAKTKRPNPDEVISRHRYERDSQSGAGNCWCGRHEGHRIHQWSRPPVSSSRDTPEKGER